MAGTMTLRRFSFQRAKTTDHDAAAAAVASASDAAEPAAAASIRLEIMSARRGNANVVKEKSDYSLVDAKPVSEKDAQKKGVSLGVDRAGDRVVTSSRAFQFRVHDRQPLPEKEVVIHIRFVCVAVPAAGALVRCLLPPRRTRH
jgi:hypothetical protein